MRAFAGKVIRLPAGIPAVGVVARKRVAVVVVDWRLVRRGGRRREGGVGREGWNRRTGLRLPVIAAELALPLGL